MLLISHEVIKDNSVYSPVLKTVELLRAIQLEGGHWYKNCCSLPWIKKGNYEKKAYFTVIHFWVFSDISKTLQ